MRVETIGEATIYLADNREVLPVIDEVDTVVTSPPYNCGMDYGTASDSLDLDEYKRFLQATVFAAKARRMCINVGNYIGSRESRVLTRDVLAAVAGPWPMRDEIIWDKGPANGAAWGNYPNSPRIRAQHENVYVYGDLNLGDGNGLSWGEWSSLTTSIWRITPRVDLKEHPAQMPMELAERLIRLYTPVNGTVLDQFTGSGTTGVAAVRARRKFVGIEIDERHFTTACKRIEEACRQRPLFDDDQQQPEQIGLIV